MRNSWLTLKMAFRAMTWRKTPHPPVVGFAGMTGWALISLIAALALQIGTAFTWQNFSPYGLNALVAQTAIVSILTAVFVRNGQRTSVLSALFAVDVVVVLVSWIITLIAFAVYWFGWNTSFSDSSKTVIDWVWTIVWHGWFVGTQLAILRSFEWERTWQARGRVAAICIVPWVTMVVVPYEPAFRPTNFDRSTANYWEYARTWLADDKTRSGVLPEYAAARVQLQQPRLLDEAVVRLAPQRPGTTDIYAIGIAGSSTEDVFFKELRGAMAAMISILPFEGRDLALINHRSTLDDFPIASRQNFAATVRALGRVMDKDEDVLLLVMTSHGDQDGIQLALPGVTNSYLAPEDVVDMLDQAGIKNRIIIVSACYSGIFLKPLRNKSDQIIISAADDKNPSFGCSNEREWTYFGDAFFNQSVRPGKDLREAFEDAKRLIVSWEARDGLPASNPQAHFGEGLMQKLAPLLAAKSAAAASASDVR